MARRPSPAVAALLLVASCAVAAAADTTDAGSFSLYRMTSLDDPVTAESVRAVERHRLAQLASGKFGKPEDFRLEARVRLKMEARPVVVSSIPFSVGEPAGENAGWHREGQRLAWHGPGRALPLTLPLQPRGAPLPDSVSDFDTFQLEYSAVPNTPICTPQVDFGFTVQPVGPRPREPWNLLARTGAPIGTKVISEIDGEKAEWKPKDAAYLAGRWLGLAPGPDWRYAQDGPMAVLQHRMNEPLDGVEAIDVAVVPGMQVVQVNLVVAHSGHERGGDVLEIPNAIPNAVLPDGRPGVRLPVRELLEQRFADRWRERLENPSAYRPYVREILVFARGEASGYAFLKSVRKVQMLGADWPRMAGSNSRVQGKTLGTRTATVNEFRRRLDIDLGSVYDLGKARLRDAWLRVIPSSGATDCAIVIDAARAVSTYAGAVPAFASELQGWVRRMGAAVDAEAVQRDRVLEPGFVAYLPFYAFTGAKREIERPVEYALDAGVKGSLVFRPMARETGSAYRIVAPGERPRASDVPSLVTSTGATLQIASAAPKVGAEGDALDVEGASGPVTVSWPVHADITPETWFFFGMPEGADQAGRIDLKLTFADGRTFRRRIEANRALHLAAPEGATREIRLEITPGTNPYRFRLRELAFFRPEAVSYAQAVSVRLPSIRRLAPIPVPAMGDAAAPHVSPGRIAGFLRDEQVSFSTPLDPPMSALRSIKLAYRLPVTYADDEGCPIAVTFKWERGEMQRRLCVAKPSDSLVIPFADWAAGDAVPDRGLLRSIDWTLSMPGNRTRGVDESFDITIELEGLASLSMQDRLRVVPLFRVDGKPMFADPSALEALAREDPMKPLSIAVSADTLPAIIAAGSVQPPDDGFLTLEEIVARPPEPLLTEVWWALTQPPAQPPAPARRAAHLIAYPAGLVMLFVVVWLGRHRWPKLGERAKGRVAWIGRKLRTAWTAARAWGGRHWRAMNVAVGVLALGPGLFVAGRLGWTFPGVMLLLAVIFVGVGAYSHWREGRPDGWPAEHPWLRARFAMLGLGSLLAIWSLGHSTVAGEGLWGFLPLAGAVYALLPNAHGWAGSLVSRYRAMAVFAAWIALVYLVYRRGSVADFGSDRNLYYVLGAFLATFLVRAGVAALDPAVRRLLPAIADRIYGSSGGTYLAGAVLMLAATLALLAMKQNMFAEQVAIVAYYCLLFGAVKEVLALRRAARQRRAETQESPPAP